MYWVGITFSCQVSDHHELEPQMHKGLYSHIQKSRCVYVNYTSIINKVFKESPDIDSRGLIGSPHESSGTQDLSVSSRLPLSLRWLLVLHPSQLHSGSRKEEKRKATEGIAPLF